MLALIEINHTLCSPEQEVGYSISPPFFAHRDDGESDPTSSHHRV